MAHAAVLSPVSTATPSVTTGGIDWGNPIIIGALIALIGVLATAGVYMYQTHRNAKIEREKLELEREKLKTQHQHEQELAMMRLQHEQDMLRLQKELEQLVVLALAIPGANPFSGALPPPLRV